MKKIEELIYRAEKTNTDEEWLELEKDMILFLKSKHPKEEKRRIAPLGHLEAVSMICEGIRSKQKKVC